MKSRLAGFILLIISGLLLVSCKKDSFNRSADAAFRTSADSLKFDTVFTSAGSVTKSFKIFNPNNQKLLISSVRLMGGSSSAYRINVNGIASPVVNDIDIAANDSIYVFVSVFINPGSQALPFIVSDSIRIEYNGNERFVQLEAFGQNARFLRDQTITQPTTWTNDLPYVILGSLRVDTGITLNLDAGCRVYVHAGAPILVDGTMLVNGEKNREVLFTGDRLDEYYRDLPASWPGIYFRGSSLGNRMRFAIVQNAYQAIACLEPASDNQPKLRLQQCIIRNSFDAGLIGYRSRIDAENCLIANCGKNITVQFGGEYQFTHCTVAAYANAFIPHKEPVLSVANFTTAGGSLQTAACRAVFRNCVFWGSPGLVDDEVRLLKEGNSTFEIELENCLYRGLNDPAPALLTNNIRNTEPLFDSIDVANRYFDFHTNNTSSPLIDAGVNTSLVRDLDDAPRPVGIPDIGAYEKQ